MHLRTFAVRSGLRIDVSSQVFGASQEIRYIRKTLNLHTWRCCEQQPLWWSHCDGYLVIYGALRSWKSRPDLLWLLFMPRLHSWRDESRSEAHEVVLYFAPP